MSRAMASPGIHVFCVHIFFIPHIAIERPAYACRINVFISHYITFGEIHWLQRGVQRCLYYYFVFMFSMRVFMFVNVFFVYVIEN